MWGKFTEFVQDKLESSSNEDDKSGEAAHESKTTIENLRKALNDAEGRNKDINREFKKLLREKEDELKTLREELTRGGATGRDGNSQYSSTVFGLEEQVKKLKEELAEKDLEMEVTKTKLEEKTDLASAQKNAKAGSSQAGAADKRIEELEELLAQKDKNLQHLLQELEIAEQQRKQTWEQKRINEEKVMGELAAKIQQNASLVTKLEEIEQLLAEREKSIQELCDKNEAKERLIRSRDEVISHLQMSKDVSGGADGAVSVLQEQVRSQQLKITELADEVDSYRRNLKEKESIINARETSLESIQLQMEEQTRALSQLTVERDNLIERISSMEQEHNETVAMWQQQVRMKEETLAAEISQLETSFKESEHMLKEEVEEKANIIQSKDEAIAVLKRTIHERALGSSPDVGSRGMSGEGEKLVQILEKQLEESKELLNHKRDALEKYEKELKEKDHEIRELKTQSHLNLKNVEEKLENEKLLTEELKKQLMDKQNEIRESAIKLDHLKEQLDCTSKELNLVKDNLKKKSEMLSKHEHETQNASDKVSDLSQTLKKLENTLAGREAKITELNILTGKLQERLESLGNENQRIAEVMEEMKKDLTQQLVEAQDELKRTREKYETELSEKELKIKQQQEYLEEKDRTIGFLNEEMAEERRELAEQLEGSIKENDEINRDLQLCKEEMETKREENVSLAKQIDELERKVEEMASETSRTVEDFNAQEKLENVTSVKQKTEIDILQKEKSLLEEKLEELNDVNGNLTRKLQEFHRLNDDAENEKLELLSQIGNLEQRISQNEKPVDELTEVGGEETKLEVSECSEPALGKIDITQLELTPDEELRSSVKKDGDVVYDRQGDLVPSVHRKVEELEKNFYIVENQLTEEVNKNKSLKERLQNLQEEKNNADIRCTELKQALEEFIYSTDKRGNKDLHHKSPNGDQQEIDKTIQDDEDVSTMFQDQETPETKALTATSNSFGEVVRLLEEEKGALERKLEVATKERNALRVHVEELEEMLENAKRSTNELAPSRDVWNYQLGNIEDIAEETDTLRTRVHVSEEVEHQLQEQVRFYQEELQRESEDNEVFRNSLADLETQLKSSIKEKRELLEKLKHSESLKLEMEELRKENSSLYEEKKTIKNDLERTQLEAKRKNQDDQQMLTEVTEALNARVEEREELLRQAKIMEKQLNNELQEVKSMNVTLQDMNNRLREENESIKTKDDEIASLKETIEQKNLIEDQLDNAKKLLAKMKKKFAVFREEKQAELEKKDEDISQLLDRVAEVESIRRIEGEKVDEQIKQLSERIIEAEVVNEKVIKGKNEEVRGMLEKISQMENANEEAIQAKVVEIGQMSERVRVAELQHERIIKEKNEIAGMKEDLQIELDHANEFMVSQIALLKQELLESQKSLAESESEVELLRERLSSNEEQLTEMHEIENGLLKQLQEKDNELERLRLEREKDKSSVAVEEMSATNVEVSESMIEEEAPLTTRDDGTSLKSLLEDKELALKEQGQQLQMIAKKFTALRKKFGQQKDQMKDINEVNKRLKEEKEELSKMYGGVSDRLAEYQDLSEQKKVLENALNSKEKALELLNSDVKRLQESIAVLEGEKRNVEISLARSEEEVTSFRGQLDVMSEQLDFMAKQRGALTEEVNLKDGEIHSLLRKLEESKVLAQKKEQELEQVKKSMDEEYSTHSETLALWKSHVESYVGEISELQKELQEKNKLVHENDAEITSLRVELNDVILQKEQLKSTLQVKVDEERAYEEAAEGFATLKEEYEEQGMEIFSLKQELQQARQQIEAMDELVEQKRSLEGLLEVREVEMNDLRCQSTDVRNLKEQVNAKDQELQQLQEVLEEKSAVERKLAVEVESLREEVGKYVQQIADLEGTASDQSLGNDLQEQLDRDVLQIQELQEVLKQKSTIEERLSGEVDSLRTELSRSSRRIAELESSLTEQSLGDDLREQLDRKDIELQQLKSLLNEKSAIERKLSNEMECFKAERIESSLRIAELENSVRQQNLADDLQARLQDAQEKVVKLTDALEQSQRNAEEIEGKYDELRLEKCSLEEILDNKEQELSYLRDVMAKCANLEKSEAKKDEELARSRQSQASQDDMIRNLRSELGLKNAEITALEDKMNVFEHLSEELRTAKTRIEELEKMLEESSSKGELKDVSQVEKRGVGSSNEGLKESEKQDHVSMQEKLTVMDKERLQFRKKLATMKKASIEIGKQNKQLQSVLDEKEKEISDLKILVNETKNRENELTNTVRDLKSDKEAVEAEFEDTVKELKELVKEKQDLVQERNNLNQVVQRLEAEKDWNKSEAENLREDLEVKTRECSTLKKELDTMKTSLEDQIKKKIEDLVMEKDLEKAECEEQFARQINDVCAQKDKIISQLRDSSAELSTVKQQEIDNLKDLLEKKDMIINRFKDNVTTEIHDGSNPDDTDQTLQDTMSIKDELIEQLTEEVRNLKDEIQIVGDGREALDKKLHQALMEKQKLHEQLQLLGEERDKLSQKQQNSINNQGSQKDLETTIQQKDKVISAMKKKIKELRREKAAAELKSKRDEEEKGLELIRGQSVEDPHVIQEFYQKTEQDVVQAVDGIKDKNDLEVNYEKLTDELTHVRHERNVYEESYIQLQRDLDQSQKENESLRAEIQSNQSIIDGFDSKLEETTTSMKKEFQDHIKEREKSMSELHGKERSMMENFMEKLRREKLRMESEMTKIQEDQESLLKDKEEISKRNSEMKHTLDTAVEQLETTREELNSLKEKCCQLTAKNNQSQADIDITKKAKEKMKQKLKELMKRFELEKTALQEELQRVKVEKAETCTALRNEFGDALASRDKVVNSLKGKLDTLKFEKQESEEQYEKICRELRSSLKENIDNNKKLEEEAMKSNISLENVNTELAKVRREKDSIGNTIRSEFDHICSGLRMDLENTLKEKEEIYRALEVGRLGLEKELVEKEETVDGLMQLVKVKDEISDGEKAESLKAELERFKRDLSGMHVKLGQEKKVVEQKNAVIQTLEDDRKRLLSERDEALAKAQQEVATISSLKDHVLQNLESKLSETAKAHVMLSEKYEEVEREFQTVVEHIVSSVQESTDDSSVLELLEKECPTAKDKRVRCNLVVSQVINNWMETRGCIEKESRKWRAEEEGYKLEIENLTKEKQESCEEIKNKLLTNLEEKDEQLEGLASQLNKSRNENERIKEDSLCKIKELKETLDNGHNSHLVEKAKMMEKLKDAALQIQESEKELAKLRKRIEMDEQEIKILNEEKHSLQEMTKEFDSIVAEKKEEADSLRRDLDVVQNERNHFEQSLIKNVDRANDDFNELLTILGQDKLCEIQDVPKKKNKLLDVVSLLVKEVEKNGDLHNKLKEEKTKICQEIREQFETTLHEKENILEELGVKLRDLHKECSKLKAENEEKNNEMTELRSKLSGLPDAENINEANKRALSEMGSKTREEIKLVEVDAQERDQITKGVVENVLAERLEKPLEAPLLVDFTENENVLRNEISKLTEQNTSLKEEVENLQNIYNERNSQTCQLVEDVIALREENNSLKRALELSTLEQSQLSSIKEENETIRQDIENLQIANRNLKDKVELSRTQVKEDSRGDNAEKTEVELMAIIRDKELVNQRLEENLMECTKNVNQLKDELARAGKERLEYERLRRDFDHIVSGLRGDLERALSDREDKSRMLDELRTHVGDIREKDSSEERTYDAHGISSDTIEKELEDVKVRLREMTLVNRQLKQLGKSLKAELKETRRDKQHSEKKCQDLRNEMESFVKDKEATIMESRERMETSERMFNKKVDDLRKEYDDKIREIASNKKYSTHDYNELQSVNEELQIKLNDAYEEINNIAQIEETNVMLKQEIETMRLQNGSLMEKVEELKDVINEADEQIELRDNRLKELQENLQGMNDEKLQIEQQLHEITVNLDNQVQVEAGRDGMLETMSNLGKEGKEPVTDGGDDVAKNNVYLSQYSQALEVTSESAKLQRELMQTSPDRSQDEIKQPSDQSYSKDKENHIKVLEQQLEQTQKSKALTELDLEKSRKISAKLKSMVKNSRTEVETLRDDLVSAKNDTLQKEQAMQRLRTDMADLVKEKEKLVEKLMTRLRASDLDKDESINNLRYKYEVILKKRKADLEEVSRELNETSSRADELKAQLDMWRSSYNDVCEKNNELEIELRNMRNILDHSVAEHNRTKETSSKRINEADKTIEELTERLRKKTQDFENSEKYKSEVEENLVLRAQMDSNMTSKDSVIDDLQKELQVAKESLQRAQTELQEKSIGFESLWQQREKSKERFLSYQEEVNGSLSKKDKVIRKLEDDLQNANENIHDIAKKLKEKSDHCDVAQTEKDVLQLRLNETQKESENATLVQEEMIADATRNLDAANGRVEELLKKLNETSLMLIMERNRKEELDEISATLRKDLELRTEQKRELEDVVMNLNMDLEKALRDREELRQALRVKQTVTQGCDNACFDEEILLEKEKEISVLEVKFEEKEKEVSAMNQKLNDVQMVHQDLSYEHEKTKEVFQKTLANHQNERKRLEETIAQLQQELQQTLCTKEEAVNVLRMKLEEAVEERGDLASSLKSEYDKMLTEKDERITRLQEDVHRVNEEFTNLGYRFELTLQDNVNKGNAIVQLQNELKEKARIVEENSRLQLRVESMVQRINELEEEMDHLKDETNKSDAQKLFEELQNTKAMVKALEKQLTSIRKECEVSKAKQKKEFKRLSEALQFDLEHCRKQNLEKEKSLQNLRVELEEVVKQKEALFQRLRTPTKVKSVERLQKAADETLGFADGNLVEKLREEKTELLRDLEKARQQKDEIFTKFHHISDGLRRDLEEAINMRDQKVQESLEVNIMLDKVDRENTELRTQLKEKETIISKLTANLEKKGERNDLMMEQLRAENEKVKTALAQELMNSRQNILKTHNANEELKQSLVKAEFDRENLRNYIATKELQSEELKRQLVREVAARKRVSEELRAEGMKNVEETFLESSLENFESFNKTRNECDETDGVLDSSLIGQQSEAKRFNQLSSRLAEAMTVQEETNLQLAELEEALREERTRREELEMLLDEQYKRTDHRVDIEVEATKELANSPAEQRGQFYSYRPSTINRRGHPSLFSLRGCLHSSGLLARLLCSQTRGRWPLMLYLLFLHAIVVLCLFWTYVGQ